MESAPSLVSMTCKAKKPHVESSITFRHQTLALCRQPDSRDLFLSIRDLVFPCLRAGLGIIWEAGNTQGTRFGFRDSPHARLSPSLRLDVFCWMYSAGMFAAPESCFVLMLPFFLSSFYNWQTSFFWASAACVTQRNSQNALHLWLYRTTNCFLGKQTLQMYCSGSIFKN